MGESGVEAMQDRPPPYLTYRCIRSSQFEREGGEWLQLNLQADDRNLFARPASTPTLLRPVGTDNDSLRFWQKKLTLLPCLMGRKNLRLRGGFCAREHKFLSQGGYSSRESRMVYDGEKEDGITKAASAGVTIDGSRGSFW